MIVLGADLSYTRTGLVWLNRMEVLHYTTCTIKPGPDRLARAVAQFSSAIKKDKTFVDLAVIEDVAIGAPSRTTVCKLTELSAMFKLVLEIRGIPYLYTSPTLIKKYITGKGTAEKHVVAQELKRRWGIEFKDDKGFDLSDAAACAVWGLLQHGK